MSCYGNQIKTLDVKNLTKLRELCCSSNPIKTLSLEKLTKLKRLYCVDTKLQSLNVTTCTSLEEISCGSGSLKKIDAGGLKKLYALDCSCYDEKAAFPLYFLNVQNDEKLEDVRVYGTDKLKKIYAYNCPELSESNFEGRKLIRKPYNGSF